MNVRKSFTALALLFLGWSAAHAEQYTVPLFLAPGTSGDPQGVLRLVNDTGEAATVQVFAIADDGTRAGPATIALGASAAAEFDATELQSANAVKGLSGGLGSFSGDVRLLVDSDAPIVPLAFVRASDGTLSAMHDAVRAATTEAGQHSYEVPIFNLSTAVVQASRLRLINPGDTPAAVVIEGRDDGASAATGTVRLSLPAGGARTLTAQQLEAGGTGLTGQLGAGIGRWRLTVTSDRPLSVVNVAASSTGYWNNLSTTAVRGAAPAKLSGFDNRFVGESVVLEMEGGRFELMFMENGRVSETVQTDGMFATGEGGYDYVGLGPDAGSLMLDYDDGSQCRANLYFSSRMEGWFASRCTGGADPGGTRAGGNWFVEGGEDDGGGGPIETTYGMGDALPGFDPGSDFFSVTSSVGGGVSASSGGGGWTATMDDGGWFQMRDGTRYTCASAGGCGIADGTVTRGSVTGRTAGSGGGEIDRFPVFPAAGRPGDQTYTVGTAVDALSLPEATGGNPPLTHSLSPDVPGLNFDAAARTLMGTPTAAGSYAMSYTATDVDGDLYTLHFTIEVKAKVKLSNRATLVALYNATNGPDWARSENWLTDAPIGEWQGVNVRNGQVYDLEISNNGLSGPIPQEIANLTGLESLYLYGNALTGSIPPDLGNLTQLVHLDLDNNALTGSIPPELGNLANLETLGLSGNNLTGSIPPELGNLVRLVYLSLGFNALTGPIPPELGNLVRLRDLYLWINQLSGSIPRELGNLTNLEVLFLGGNNLTGSIPPELGNLVKLRDLDLSGNNLAPGPIPSEFVTLANLESLGLPGSICVPADLVAWAVEQRVSVFKCTPEGRLLPSALIREDSNGLSLALPGDLREPSAVTVSDSSVVAASVADGWLELVPRGLGAAEVELVPSGGGAPANARVVVRAAVGTFGIDIVMDRPAPVTYEEALMVGADWWSSVLDGTEWPDRRPDCFSERATALADELLIHARIDRETDAAGYALTCFRDDGNQAVLDPGGGVVVAAPQSANPYLVRHEIGHLLGLVLWRPESGLAAEGEEYLYFTGEQAMNAFLAAGGDPDLPGVPFDGVHWAYGVVDDFMASGSHGTISAAALADAGYEVNMDKATDSLDWWRGRSLGSAKPIADQVSEVVAR